jgi:hypothetical protein
MARKALTRSTARLGILLREAQVNTGTLLENEEWDFPRELIPTIRAMGL